MAIVGKYPSIEINTNLGVEFNGSNHSCGSAVHVFGSMISQICCEVPKRLRIRNGSHLWAPVMTWRGFNSICKLCRRL